MQDNEQKIKYLRENLTGRTFERLKVLEYVGHGKWKCECSCENKTIKYVRTNELTSGGTKSCGCLHSEIVQQKRRNSEDITGRTINNLIVLSYSHSDDRGACWLCECKLCGKKVIFPTVAINRNKSCGCLEIKSAEEASKKLMAGLVFETNVHLIKSKTISSKNTTGVRGVYYSTRGKAYVARISFRGTRYPLGSFKHLKDAEIARKKAEENLYENFLDWYYNEYLKEKSSREKQHGKSSTDPDNQE